jgi:hypothetical protein
MKDLKQVINENKDTLKDKGWTFLKRNYLVIAVVILVLLLLRQCNANNALKKETKREHNDYLAAQDSVTLG